MGRTVEKGIAWEFCAPDTVEVAADPLDHGEGEKPAAIGPDTLHPHPLFAAHLRDLPQQSSTMCYQGRICVIQTLKWPLGLVCESDKEGRCSIKKASIGYAPSKSSAADGPSGTAGLHTEECGKSS